MASDEGALQKDLALNEAQELTETPLMRHRSQEIGDLSVTRQIQTMNFIMGNRLVWIMYCSALEIH